MTPETLASVAAILLSLLTSYLPGFSDWYASLEAIQKRLLMLGLLLLVAIAAFAAACTQLAGPLGLAAGEPTVCDAPSAYALLRAFVAALISSQAAFLISPKKATAATGRSIQ